MAFNINPLPDAGDIDEVVWLEVLDNGSGVIEDTTGGSLEVTATGANTETVVAIGTCRVKGFRGRNPSVNNLDHSSVFGATNPTSGEQRVDDILVEYDTNALSLNDAMSVVIDAGTPVPIGTALPGPPATVDGTRHRLWLARVVWEDGTAITNSMITDTRLWLGADLYAAPGTPLPDDAPLGTKVNEVPAGRSFVRALSGGSPDWVEVNVLATAVRQDASGYAINSSGSENTWVKVNFDTDIQMPDGMSAFGRGVLAGATGRYLITCPLEWNGSGFRGIRLVVESQAGSFIRRKGETYFGIVNGAIRQSISDIIRCEAGNVMYVEVLTTTGTTPTSTQGELPLMTVCRVS